MSTIRTAGRLSRMIKHIIPPYVTGSKATERTQASGALYFNQTSANVAAAEARIRLQLDFKLGGNGLPFLRHGWSGPEADFVWTEGNTADLEVFAPCPGRYLLCLDAMPMGMQRLTVAVDDVDRGEYRFDFPFSIVLPVDTREGAPLTIRLRMPDANSPANLFGAEDTRVLGFAFSRLRLLQREVPARLLPALSEDEIAARITITPADLMLNFESLGHNCEFGVVQRRFGAEPLGLLRFGGISLPNLMRGLATDFVGLGQAAGFSHTFWDKTADPEYIVREETYGLQYYSGSRPSEIDVPELYEREEKRLTFYRRKLLEEIAAARKIFVFQWPGSLLAQDVMPIVEALNRRGKNTLLWVVASPEYPPGTVEVLAPCLLRGYVERFAPIGLVHKEVHLAQWLNVCANAHLFHRGQVRVR